MKHPLQQPMNLSEIVIDPMRPEDWPAVRRIYQEGIETGIATFETEVPDWASWDAARLPACRLVALSQPRSEGEVLGWAALSPVSRRPVYRGVAEVSVYVARDARGRGVGRALLHRLVRDSEEAGIWTLQASIFPENEASIALHRQAGFRIVGVRERIGQRHGRWHDNVLMERRSPVVGC